jgi:hypothetical protein
VYVSKCVCQKLFYSLLVHTSSDAFGCVEPLVELLCFHPLLEKTTFTTALGPLLDDGNACSTGGANRVVLREPITIPAVEVEQVTGDRCEKRTAVAIQVDEVDQLTGDRREKRAVGAIQGVEVDQFTGDRCEKRTVGARQVDEVDQFWWNRLQRLTPATSNMSQWNQFVHRVVGPCFADDAHFFILWLEE